MAIGTRFYAGCSQAPLVPLFVFCFVMIIDMIVSSYMIPQPSAAVCTLTLSHTVRFAIHDPIWDLPPQFEMSGLIGRQ